VDEPFVSGNINDADAALVGKFARREAQVDRHAAGLFLGEPVGVTARKVFHKLGLAMVDVTGRADRQGDGP